MAVDEVVCERAVCVLRCQQVRPEHETCSWSLAPSCELGRSYRAEPHNPLEPSERHRAGPAFESVVQAKVPAVAVTLLYLSLAEDCNRAANVPAASVAAEDAFSRVCQPTHARMTVLLTAHETPGCALGLRQR